LEKHKFLTNKNKSMKKKISPYKSGSYVFKILLCMRLTVFLILLNVLGVYAKESYSQNFNLDYKNTSIKQILEDIKKQSELEFFFSNDDFDTGAKINISVKDGTLEEVLEVILPADMQYQLVDHTVIISKVKSPETVPQPDQQNIIKGKVTDEEGKPLPGVTITIVGTTRGVITDNDGSYSIEANPNDKLVFSFIGMESQIIDVGNQKTIKVEMKEKIDELEEVTVVAFGKQKKESVVGSISTVNTRELEKISTSNLTTALAGQVAGIISYQRTGEPGEDNADFFVRGVTTFGYKKDPLILIDGIELTATDLARLQKDDIAAFSILKDATATALYGARGANGVILVETKQGFEGKAKISARFENSISAPTKNIELADAVTYMQMHTEAVRTRNPLGAVRYTQRRIDNTIEGSNPFAYPTNDWYDLLMKDYTTNQRMNMNISGGGKTARYYVAGSYNNDNGIMKTHETNNFNNNIDLKSYTLRANVNINVSNSTELLVKLNGSFDDYTGPIDGGAKIYKMVMQANPAHFPPYYPRTDEYRYANHILFGNAEDGNYLNPYAEMLKGYKDYSRSRMLAQVELKQNLDFVTEGLDLSAMINTNRVSYFDVQRFYNPFYYQSANYDRRTNSYDLFLLNEDSATEYLNYREGEKDISSSFYLQSILNYNRNFGKHGIGGLLVYRMTENLKGNTGDVQSSLPFRNLGLSGRLTYSFDNRYFTEFNFGYNGSERFHKSHRYGFFPAAGIAWNISNENFWNPIKPVITNLKIRGSYGIVGNDAIGSPENRFLYLSNVSMNSSDRSATFGTEGSYSKNGIYIDRYANSDITWEEAYKTNVALEIGFFEKVNIQAEYFHEYRKNIFMERAAIPNTMGLQAAIGANVGEASGSGVDLSVDYQQTWNNSMWLSVRGNFTYAKNQYEVYEEPQYDEYWRSRVGYSIQQQYGYIAERLFIDDADANNSPKQNFGFYGGGDIKYLDVNNDGEITEADKVPIGNPTIPEIVYGFGFSYGYKNFDISAFFQGLANESFWVNPSNVAPFVEVPAGSDFANDTYIRETAYLLRSS
jgi:TonB-linked SusC/RagA family outer membrane protein